MNHLLILPVLVPFAAAIVSMIAHRAGIRAVRTVSAVSTGIVLAVAIYLLISASTGDISVYALGNWRAPFGIVLVLDRLAAIMIALAAAIAVPALWFAAFGTDTAGRHFHALFQLQLAGLNGAFLTGDLFNLFVFFEVLLLASYGLLSHGAGLARSRAGLTYVIMNLAGSALFLVSLGLLYGMLGTLNVADMANALARVPMPDQALLRVGIVLLVVVFLLKAALLPLSLWLPHAYAAASPPVAAIFAIMTKVGIYALLRISVIILDGSPFAADLLEPWLMPLALATIVMGTAGALAATRLAGVAANLIMISTGTLTMAITARNVDVTAAALFYMTHTTMVTAGLFVLSGHIAAARHPAGDSLKDGPTLANAKGLGAAFLVLAVAVSGMPPLSGFIGKIMLMTSLQAGSYGYVIWFALVVSGFAVALVLARGASILFWETSPGTIGPHINELAGALTYAPLILLVCASPILAVSAPAVSGYVQEAAAQIHARQPYIAAVLGERPHIERDRRP